MKKQVILMWAAFTIVVMYSFLAQAAELTTTETAVSVEKIYKAVENNSYKINDIIQSIVPMENKLKSVASEIKADKQAIEMMSYRIDKIKRELSDVPLNKESIKFLSEKLDLIEKRLTESEGLINQEINKNKKADSVFESEIKTLSSNLAKLNQSIVDLNNTTRREIDSTRMEINSTKDTFDGSKRKLKIILIIIGLIGGLLLGYIFLRLRKVNIDSQSELKNIKRKYNESVSNLDIKIIEELKQVLEGLKVPNVQDNRKIDHSLPLKVADEINRMRTRIANMPEDTVGIKALGKALERLEEKLNDLDYTIVDLIGKPYWDGLTVQARFAASDNLKKEKRVITKIFKPQVNYKGVLIQAADVEVNF
ncbi:MAG: hypothetical protein KJ915_03100 [Candidatus Omnitrophica bacterium]|nr:hypothetical protein [Candidatus Omnitrophota bacterium]